MPLLDGGMFETFKKLSLSGTSHFWNLYKSPQGIIEDIYKVDEVSNDALQEKETEVTFVIGEEKKYVPTFLAASVAVALAQVNGGEGVLCFSSAAMEFSPRSCAL